MNCATIKKQIKEYAKSEQFDHLDAKTGEMSATALYEDICNHFNLEPDSELDAFAEDYAAFLADEFNNNL